MSDHAHNPADRSGALGGFFGGVVALLIVLGGIVYWTNGRYAAHDGGDKPAAEAAK